MLSIDGLQLGGEDRSKEERNEIRESGEEIGMTVSSIATILILCYAKRKKNLLSVRVKLAADFSPFNPYRSERSSFLPRELICTEGLLQMSPRARAPNSRHYDYRVVVATEVHQANRCERIAHADRSRREDRRSVQYNVTYV